MTRIYLITNKVNGKQYVGKTKYTLAHRFTQHCTRDYHTYIHNAIQKYGRENFKIEEICKTDDEHWKELETFYIKFYHTHYTEGGYNVSWGGDNNPMDEESVIAKHKSIMSSAEMIEKTRKPFDEWNYGNTEKRLAFNKQVSERQSGIYPKGFEQHNNQKKIRVGMIENNVVIKEFDSVADALKYLGKPTKEAGNLLKYADKYNKNGKRAKTFGYSWTKL